MSVEGPSASLPGRGQLSPEQERRLRQVVEEFLDKLQAGAAPDRPALLASHPDLAAALDSRLELVERVYRAVRPSDESGRPAGQGAAASAGTSGTEKDPALTAHSASVAAPTSAYLSASGNEAAAGRGVPTVAERADHLDCPHCGKPIQLVSPQPQEITCINCGSSFRVHAEARRPRGPIRIPDRIGRFVVKGVLGRGGFGVVYKAVDAELDRTVAIKVPRSGYFTSQEEEERFLREARHAARLKHPNIVQVHEIGHEFGVPYIVSDYIEGVTLADRMHAGLMTFRESAELVATVCDALDFAHREKVIHRDIKPGNILLDLAGRPFLNDFGLARRDEGEITVTLDGQVLGTPAFMSPEQASGNHHKVGPHSDVYSLGVVLYSLISGELPFHGNRPMLLHQVIHDDPRPPSSLNQHIPRDIATICMKAMAKEPSRRYASAREMADDLRRWLNGEPILARPVGRIERWLRWCRRNPIVAGLAASIAAMLVLFTLGALVSAWNDRRLRAAAEQAEQNEARERARAEQNAEQSRRRLAQLHTTNGVQLLDEGDLFGSMPWFAAALRLDAGDRDREFVQRVRLGTILRAGPKLAQLFIHQAAVRHAEISPDARRAITAGDDDAARVWDLASGHELATLRHGDAVLWAAFSPDSRRAVTASRDRTAAVWNLADDQPQPLRLQHKDSVKSVAFSPDGRLVLTASNDNTAVVWNSTTGEAMHVLEHTADVLIAAFSRDGARVVTVSNAGFSAAGEARVWSAEAGDLVAGPFQHADYIYHASFSPDGRRLVTASEDATAIVWDIETSERIADVRHQAGVRTAFFTADGRSILTASSDGTARAWEIDSGAAGPAIKHKDMLVWAASAEHSPIVATASIDGSARVWTTHTAEPLTPPLRHADVVQHVALSGDGRWVLTAGRDHVAKLWDLATGELSTPPLQHAAAVTAAEFSPNGELVATASDDKTAAIWNVADSLAPVRVLQHADRVRHVAFSPDGRTVVTSSADGQAQVWDGLGRPLDQPLRHSDAVWSSTFSPSGEFVATASNDGTAKLWNAATGEPKATLRHGGPVFAALFSPDSRFLVTASEDHTARLWNVAAGEAWGHPLQHDDRVVAAGFSPDGRLVATASADRTAKVWDLATGRLIATLPHTGSVWSARFSPDGRRLATASLLGAAGLWDGATGQSAAQTLRHDGYQVRHVAFSRDSRLLVTVGNRNTQRAGASRLDAGVARLWDVASGQLVSPPLRHGALVRAAWFNHDGSRLVTSSEDHTAQLWSVGPDERAVEDLVRLTELLAGHRVQAVGGLVPLPASEIGALWADVRTKIPLAFVASETELAAWRIRQARLTADVK